MEWQVFLELEANHFHREDWYAAQIVAEIRRGWCTKPKEVHTKDFLLKFKDAEVDAQPAAPTQEQIEERQQRSRSFWGALIGVDMKRKN